MHADGQMLRYTMRAKTANPRILSRALKVISECLIFFRLLIGATRMDANFPT